MNTADADNKRRLVEQSFADAAPTYAQNPLFFEPGRRLAEAAGINAGDRVLDIATGRGAVLFPGLELVGDRGYIQGIDLAQPMVSATQSDIDERGLRNCNVRQMNAEHLEFETASFDVVTCGFALWFIPDMYGALAEIRRVLKPSGHFAATTWAPLPDIHLKLREVLSKYGAGMESFTSHSLTTQATLGDALRQAGFEDVAVSNLDFAIMYKDPNEWWQLTGSAPQMYKQLGAEKVALVREEALTMAETFMGPDGIRVERCALLGTARAPL